MAPNDEKQSKQSTKKDIGEGFARLAEGRQAGLIREYWGFIRHTGKYWMIPLFLLLGLVAALAVLAGTSAAPFIYALF